MRYILSDLRLSIVECRYPEIVHDELLKDQFIFRLEIKEIQDHLLGEIKAEDSSRECLLESRKIESKIEQRKLLSIKTDMTYDAIHRGRDKFRNKSKSRGRSKSDIRNCKYCGKSHNRDNCLLLAKSAKSVVKTTTSKLYAKVVWMEEEIEIIVNQDIREKTKAKNSMR